MLEKLSHVEGKEGEKEEFIKVIKDIQLFSEKTDRVLDKFIRSESSWVMNAFLKII